MLIKSADDKSWRLALLQDLQQSSILDARPQQHVATRVAPKLSTTAGQNTNKSLSPLHKVVGLRQLLEPSYTN